MAVQSFSNRVLKWFDIHGRKDLPWGKNSSDKKNTPYRVLVSEIMLQQTQVATVIPYFQKFMARFPSVNDLAIAPVDEVLHLWSGLGYYRRARNLHATAQAIMTRHHGKFPDEVDALALMPGIGRSTAGAVISIAFDKPAAILDGNVKRVLARHYAIEGLPTKSTVAKIFWAHAEKNTPAQRVADYTQAIMDLGATVCTSNKPRCETCPLKSTCVARREGTQERYPQRAVKNKIPVKSLQLLMLVNQQGEVLLEQRPPQGIWGGLWSFPELASDQDAVSWCQSHFKVRVKHHERWLEHTHTFSHFRLLIQPVLLEVALTKPHTRIMDGDKTLWVKLNSADNGGALVSLPRKGLAAPVSRLLKQVEINHVEKTYDT